MKYGIRSIPTLLVFKNGEIVDRAVGAMPKSELAKKLDGQLA
jgi:thioredoxin 1